MAGAYSQENIDSNDHMRTKPQNEEQKRIAEQVGQTHLENA